MESPRLVLLSPPLPPPPRGNHAAMSAILLVGGYNDETGLIVVGPPRLRRKDSDDDFDGEKASARTTLPRPTAPLKPEPFVTLPEDQSVDNMVAKRQNVAVATTNA